MLNSVFSTGQTAVGGSYVAYVRQASMYALGGSGENIQMMERVALFNKEALAKAQRQGMSKREFFRQAEARGTAASNPDGYESDHGRAAAAGGSGSAGGFGGTGGFGTGGGSSMGGVFGGGNGFFGNGNGDRPPSSPPPPPPSGGSGGGDDRGSSGDQPHDPDRGRSTSQEKGKERRRSPSPTFFGGPPTEDTTWHFDRKETTRGFQDHHIISPTNRETKEHELFEKAGLDMQSRANRIYLPTEESQHPTRSIHIGRHTQKHSKEERQKMDDAVEQGKREDWSPEQYRQKLLEILSGNRQGLRSGETALNRRRRPWAKS